MSNIRLKRFEWDDELLTGIAMIDAQHQEYFRRVNQALDCAGDEHEPQSLRFMKELQFVQQYALDHFDAEQGVMTFNEYPGYDGHLAQHQVFAARLDALAEALDKEGFRPDEMARLHALLVDWFVKHIRTEDRRLADYIRARGEKTEA
jgi:hemerythrin-like metal-binding protein